jgi:hypothetical protein
MDPTSVPQISISIHDDKTPYPSPEPKYQPQYPEVPSFQEDNERNTHHIPNLPSAARQGLLKTLSEDDVTQDLSYGLQGATLPSSSSSTTEYRIESKLSRAQTSEVRGSNSSSEFVTPRRATTEIPLEFRKQKQDESLAKRVATILQKHKPYFPSERLASIVADDAAIRTALHSEEGVEESTIVFSKRNLKVFAITLLALQVTSDRQLAMEIFAHDLYRFTDACLPVVNLQNEDICSNLDGNGETCRHKEADAFHLGLWNSAKFKIFFDYQWSFCVAKLVEEVFVHHFEDQRVLPFERKVNQHGGVDESDIIGAGSFGEVQSVNILAEYQTAFQPVSQTSLHATAIN